MFTKIFITLLSLSCVYAQEATSLQELQKLYFEDAFEKRVTIPHQTQKIIVSFGKKSNAFMSEYLNQQKKNFLKKHHSIYIGDIHQMPSFVTAMFARPKMQKYQFQIYLYNEDNLTDFIPTKKDKVTILKFNTKGNIVDISYSNTAENIF